MMMAAGYEKAAGGRNGGGENKGVSLGIDLTTFGLPVKSAAAAEWVCNGFRVVPCEPLGRKPLVAGGYAVASSNVEQVKEWWARWPDANIGVAAGRGLVALVLSTPYAVTVLKRLGLDTRFLLRSTFGYKTRKGWAFLFRSDVPVSLPADFDHLEHPVCGAVKSWRRIGFEKRSHVTALGEGGGLLVPPSRLRTFNYRFRGKSGVPSFRSLGPWGHVVPFLEGWCA